MKRVEAKPQRAGGTGHRVNSRDAATHICICRGIDKETEVYIQIDANKYVFETYR